MNINCPGTTNSTSTREVLALTPAIKHNTDTAESLTTQAVLVSAQPSAAIYSFHEPEQLGSEGGASSSYLQLSGTRCRFTFDPHPSVAVSFEQGSRLIFSGCSLSLTFPLKTAEEIELN